MPLDAEAEGELKSLIAVSRKRDLNFGLCLADKPADTALLIHRIKAPDILMRLAKKADGVQAAKAACGTLSTKGKVMTLCCEKDAPAGTAKRLRFFFREIGLQMKVVLLGPDGDVLEQDGEEDEDQTNAAETPLTGDAASGQTGTVDSMMQKWEQAKALMEPRVLAFLKADQGDASTVRAAWAHACSNADEGDHAGGLKVLARLAPLLKATPAADPATPDRAEDGSSLKADVAELLRTLKTDLAAHQNDGSPALDRVHKLFAAGMATIKRDDLRPAFRALMACTDALAEVARSQRAAEARAAVPEGIVATAVSALETNIAILKAQRLRSIAGLDALIKLLKAEEDPDLHKIAGEIDGLRRDLPEALEDNLNRMKLALEAGDQDGAGKEKTAARGLVAEAARYLKDHQKQLRLCEANPFGVTLDVVSPLAEALRTVQQSLARI